MSFDRNRWGFDGELSFSCDECDNEEHTETSVWRDALDHIKKYGWKTVKVNEDWMHFCGEDCLAEYKREDLDDDFEDLK